MGRQDKRGDDLIMGGADFKALLKAANVLSYIVGELQREGIPKGWVDLDGDKVTDVDLARWELIVAEAFDGAGSTRHADGSDWVFRPGEGDG